MLAAFLAGGLPALKLHPLGLAPAAVEDGVRWGGVAGGAAAIAIGLLALAGLSWVDAAAKTRRIGSVAVALGAPVGAMAVGFGAWLGPVLAGASSSEASAVLARTWWYAAPVVVAPLAMAAAVALTARRTEASSA